MVKNRIDASSPASLRRTHRGLVLSLVQANPGVARAELARLLGFSEMAATRIVRELVEADIVEEIAGTDSRKRKPSKRLGRPKIGLMIRGEGLFAAGITVSAYHSEVTICDANGVLRARKEIPYLVSEDIGGTARAYGRELKALIDRSEIDAARIVGVGVALAARTSLKENEIVRSDYFGWGNDDGLFQRELEAAFGLPIRIDNISNALAIGEMRFGDARGVDDFVLVHVATLIGAAVMTGGKLVRGKDGVSGMIGHFRSEPSAHRCVCGRQDCLNLNATGFGILSKLGKITSGRFDRSQLQTYAARLLEVVESADKAPLLECAGASLAPALDGVCKLLGPEKVIISGYVGANAAYITGLRRALGRDFGEEMSGRLPIVAGQVAPVQAAALLALSTFCYSDLLDFERFSNPSGLVPKQREA
ncbi:ROK family transcriptional regulator [Oceanibium sediminis]|uniref:ROK family transcriptional regulator n=1 Tax=Oceanibium sediminis TaxID=2026339 RepID=UPI000DD3B9B1|nr:ROK family transcriptional regulator [Oceanibium sediminis]